MIDYYSKLHLTASQEKRISLKKYTHYKIKSFIVIFYFIGYFNQNKKQYHK